MSKEFGGHGDLGLKRRNFELFVKSKTRHILMTSLPTRLATKAMAAPTKSDDNYGSKAVVLWKYCNPYANYRWSPERPFQILGHTGKIFSIT